MSGAQDILRNVHSQSRDMVAPGSSAAFENQNPDSPYQRHVLGNKNGTTDHKNRIVPVAGAPEKMSVSLGDNVAAASEASMTDDMNGSLTGIGDDAVNYVENGLGGSSADAILSRNCSAGLDVHPRQRTLSAGVQAHLGRLAVSRHPLKQRGNGGTSAAGVRGATSADRRPTLVSRLTEAPAVSGGYKKDNTGDDATHPTNPLIVAEH